MDWRSKQRQGLSTHTIYPNTIRVNPTLLLQDWLKDHIRRGHNYTKEETDELMAKIKLDANMNGGDALLSPPAGLAISPALPTVSAV